MYQYFVYVFIVHSLCSIVYERTLHSLQTTTHIIKNKLYTMCFNAKRNYNLPSDVLCSSLFRRNTDFLQNFPPSYLATRKKLYSFLKKMYALRQDWTIP